MGITKIYLKKREGRWREEGGGEGEGGREEGKQILELSGLSHHRLKAVNIVIQFKAITFPHFFLFY